jgi:hypothetical protein
MNASLRMRGLAMFGLATLCLAGCGNKGAVEFNEKIVQANQRLAKVGEPFGRAIGPALAEQPVNLDEVRRTYKAAAEEIKNVKAESLTWKVPSGASAKNLYDAHQRFLTMQQEGIDNFGEMVKIAENGRMPAGEKKNKLQTILMQFDQKEKVALAELQSLQQAFAKDNNIRLAPAK